MVIAFVGIKAGKGEQLNLLKIIEDELKRIPDVLEAYRVFGRYDLIAKIEVESLEKLSSIVVDKIRAINGVNSTETFVVMS
ncbi:MAG: Lrp/AsnC ligand binding domain-containing protein [Candidatus Bathyarchaeia archaeon]